MYIYKEEKRVIFVELRVKRREGSREFWGGYMEGICDGYRRGVGAISISAYPPLYKSIAYTMIKCTPSLTLFEVIIIRYRCPLFKSTVARSHLNL